ncbi:MAG: DNA repair protein RadC [Bacteroidota bacterium]
MLQQNQSIKSWAEDDRPREKLMLKGKKQLSDSELIAILLNSGSREQSAVDLAKDLLASSNNDLVEFSKKNLEDLCKFKGVGEAKAITLLAALELGRRRKDAIAPQQLKIITSNQAFQYLKPFLQDLLVEEFYVLFLNRANVIIKHLQLSSGGMTGTVVDNRIIFKEAISCLASSMILAHNHPSGQLKPSEQDIRLTKKIVEFGKLVEIDVLDHLIVNDYSYFSFADSGIL